MHPLTLSDIARITHGTLVQGDASAVVTGVSTDSRSIEPNELFVPLVGPNFDGHDFVNDAFGRGAGAALVAARPNETEYTGGAVIAVDDTLRALHLLAADRRTRLTADVVAITGSDGKTTTKDMVAAVLQTRRTTEKTPGNFNNEIGLPLTLLQTDASTQVLVVEMGMRGSGQIRTLARIARPHIGIVTNVSPVHLELLGTVEAIAAAKRELVEQLPATGTAVLNGDDEQVLAMAGATEARVITYGLGATNDVRATDVADEAAGGVHFTLHYEGRTTRVHVPAPGFHNVYNALAAAAAAFAVGLDATDVAAGLAAYPAQRSGMRLEIVTGPDDVCIVNDAYNASPASMRTALDLLGRMPGRRLAVLGDMLELGPIAGPEHEAVGRRVAELGLVGFVAVGRWASTMTTAAAQAGMPPAALEAVPDADTALSAIRRRLHPGDTVLVKASRGLQLERVARALTDGGKTDRSEEQS